MMRTLRLKDALRVTGKFQDFIALNMRKEEVTIAMIKDNKFFHQSNIFIKMVKPLLILLRMAKSKQPHMYKLRLMVLMVDDHIRMHMPELNDEYYLTPVTYLEDD